MKEFIKEMVLEYTQTYADIYGYLPEMSASDYIELRKQAMKEAYRQHVMLNVEKGISVQKPIEDVNKGILPIKEKQFITVKEVSDAEKQMHPPNISNEVVREDKNTKEIDDGFPKENEIVEESVSTEQEEIELLAMLGE